MGGGFGVEEVLAHLDPPRDGPKRGEEMVKGPPHLKKKGPANVMSKIIYMPGDKNKVPTQK